MFNQNDFIEKCEAAISTPNALEVITSLVNDAIAKPQDLENAFVGCDDEEHLVHVSDDLTIVHIRLTPNVHFPPHDHLMNAVVGIYEGCETHIFYDRTEHGIVAKPAVTVAAGNLVAVDVDAIHSVVNTGKNRAAALHVYLGNLVEQERSIWAPDAVTEAPYSDDVYFDLAGPYDVALPYELPAVSRAYSA